MTVREPVPQSIEISARLSMYMEYALIGQAQYLAKVHRWLYSEEFTGKEKDAELVLRFCWKALPSLDMLNERRDDVYSAL